MLYRSERLLLALDSYYYSLVVSIVLLHSLISTLILRALEYQRAEVLLSYSLTVNQVIS
jgi:hypothetical protein